MGKQKFSCKGVLRTTGQRVAITVSADSKEAALQIANSHGVTIESIMPVAEAEPAPPKAVAPKPAAPTPVAPKPFSQQTARPVENRAAEKKLDARIDDILDAEDDELGGGLDDLDLGDDEGEATGLGSPTTKACPYCGEQILAVAVKCKHCGSYVGAKAAKPRRHDDDDEPSPRAPRRVWPIVVGVVAVLVIVPIVAVVAWMMLRTPTPAPAVTPVPEPVVASPPVKPAAPPPAPKAETYKPSPEELAFAGKLTAFLDSCDTLVSLLEKGGKTEQYGKQAEVIKSRHAAIPPPPKDVAWTESATGSSGRIILALNFLAVGNATNDALAEALGQKTATDSPETRQTYKQVAGEMRPLVKAVRDMIPPECLPKAEMNRPVRRDYGAR